VPTPTPLVPGTSAPADMFVPESDWPTVTPAEVPLDVEPPAVVLDSEPELELVAPTEEPSEPVTPTDVVVSVPEVDVEIPTDVPAALTPTDVPVWVSVLPSAPDPPPVWTGPPTGTFGRVVPPPPGALPGSPAFGSVCVGPVPLPLPPFPRIGPA